MGQITLEFKFESATLEQLTLLGQCRTEKATFVHLGSSYRVTNVQNSTTPFGVMVLIGAEQLPNCATCQDEHYILHGCCSGGANQCGCMGAPVLITNCTTCNPHGTKPHGETIVEYLEHVEYRKE